VPHGSRLERVLIRRLILSSFLHQAQSQRKKRPRSERLLFESHVYTVNNRAHNLDFVCVFSCAKLKIDHVCPLMRHHSRITLSAPQKNSMALKLDSHLDYCFIGDYIAYAEVLPLRVSLRRQWHDATRAQLLIKPDYSQASLDGLPCSCRVCWSFTKGYEVWAEAFSLEGDERK
jgi:hypothetical protein